VRPLGEPRPLDKTCPIGEPEEAGDPRLEPINQAIVIVKHLEKFFRTYQQAGLQVGVWEKKNRLHQMKVQVRTASVAVEDSAVWKTLM